MQTRNVILIRIFSTISHLSQNALNVWLSVDTLYKYSKALFVVIAYLLDCGFYGSMAKMTGSIVEQ